MQNYFSVGVDAEVSRRFDTARSANPERFRSQLSNKVKYGTHPYFFSLTLPICSPY